MKIHEDFLKSTKRGQSTSSRPPDKMAGLAVEYSTSSKIWRIKLELQTNHFSAGFFS
jgi:hypothetical protein